MSRSPCVQLLYSCFTLSSHTLHLYLHTLTLRTLLVYMWKPNPWGPRSMVNSRRPLRAPPPWSAIYRVLSLRDLHFSTMSCATVSSGETLLSAFGLFTEKGTSPGEQQLARPINKDAAVCSMSKKTGRVHMVCAEVYEGVYGKTRT